MKILKILRPALSLVICIAAIVVSLSFSRNFQLNTAIITTTFGRNLSIADYSYSVTDYSYYGGDAYTGIQQAGADASNNVVVLGMTVVDAANQLFEAQKDTTKNVAALASPLNATMTTAFSIGSMLSMALAFAFAIPGVKYLFDLIQAVLEFRAEKASCQEAPAEPAAEEVCEEQPAEEVFEEE